MRKEIFPDLLPAVAAYRNAMTFVRITIDIEIRDQTTGVCEWRVGVLDVHQGAVFGQPEHLPGPAVVIHRPSLI